MSFFRIAIVTCVCLLASSTLAASWTTYHNARFGATADIPPDFAPSGPEASNSDGLIFRTRTGSLLTIYGARVNGSFEAFVQKAIDHDKSYNSWPIDGQTVTPSWAEYWGARGSAGVRVRIEAACGGKLAIVAKFEGNMVSSSTSDRVFNSLTEGSAREC